MTPIENEIRARISERIHRSIEEKIYQEDVPAGTLPLTVGVPDRLVDDPEW